VQGLDGEEMEKVKMRRIVIVLVNAFLLLSGALSGQSVQSGRSVMSGAFKSQSLLAGGGQSGPLTYSARTDAAVFGTGVTGELLPAGCASQSGAAYTLCLANAYNASATTGHQGAALSYTGGPTSVPPSAGWTVSGTNINGLNSYLAGLNKQVADPDFGATMIRATDATVNGSITCLGGGNFGASFSVGAGTATLAWAADESKLRILSSGGVPTILAFNPTTGTVTPSDLCGGYFPGGASFSGTDPHVIYTVNTDQENTVQFNGLTGSFITPETVKNGSKSATLAAINPSSGFAQLNAVSTTGSYSGNVWTGQSSGATFSAVSNPSGFGTTGTPNASTIYAGTICDGTSNAEENAVCLNNPVGGTCATNDTNPACWYVVWSLLFEFNYLPSPPDTIHFPQGPNNCLPQNFPANYTGVFTPATDDTTFTVTWGDNGQANHTGYNGSGSCPASPDGTCQGPIYLANYRRGYGCRVLNTMTDQISGDWGPQGQALDQQAYLIPGTVSGTPGLDDAWTQDVTGAATQLWCLNNSSGACAASGWTQAYTGVIYGTADATHVWRDTNGASWTPSAVPTNAPFYYPDVMHDSAQSPNNQLSKFSLVQQPDMNVTGVSYNASTHQSTITYSNGAQYSPGQQFNFFNLLGAHDSYMNCGDTDHCPVFTAVALPNGSGGYYPSGSSGTITVTDTLGGGTNFTDTESQSGCGKNCPTMTPYPQDTQSSAGGFGGTNYWQTQTLLVAADLMSTGHSSDGDHTTFQGKYYTAINQLAPWTPTTIANTGSSNPACQVAGSPCGTLYPGPLTPPPGPDGIQLLPFSVTDDQHGTMGGHGTADLTPPAFVTTQVCGQAGSGGVGGFPCEGAFSSIWDSEIIGVENWATRSSPGNLVGADCNYGSGAAPCVYRFNHTFCSDNNWLFTGQNCMGIMSPDGNWIAYPSDWNMTLGCTDLTTTNCWSSWEAVAPNASGTAVTWTSDGASPPNVTVTMSNQFCPTAGVQYYWVSGAVQTYSCGTRAGTVALTGFAESWLNQTLTLGPNTANNWQCDNADSNAGTCNQFVVASVAGAPTNSGNTETGTQKASPTACGGAPCQRTDIWISKISSAHQ